MNKTAITKLDRDLHFSKIFTDLTWENNRTDVFGKDIGYIPIFHINHDDFFNHLRATMNFYTFKFLYREHDDCIEVGWISHHWGIYKQCRTKKYSTEFLKAGTASAINAMKELAKKEKNETGTIS